VKHPAASRGASLRNPAKPRTPFFPVASQRASWRRRAPFGQMGWRNAASMAASENGAARNEETRDPRHAAWPAGMETEMAMNWN